MTIPEPLIDLIERLAVSAHKPWLYEICQQLAKALSTDDAKAVITMLPKSHNGDASYCLEKTIRQAEGVIPWSSLAVAIELTTTILTRHAARAHTELLWSGPSPTNHIPARRIDQVLYDLISTAKQEILLVTFAAYNIQRLSTLLTQAVGRGVHVKLILEFEQTSQGQLSFDALNAFPESLQKSAGIYYWPLERRELNSRGRPAKLHAKVAVIDNQAVISSANLTDDAFNRNFELGTLFEGGEMPKKMREHFEGLIMQGVLKLYE